MNMQIKEISKKEYPIQLQEISRLPQTMYIAGTIPDENYKFLCVIGSRKHTSYGRNACRQIIKGLKGYPIAIISGLAIGIDSLAHETALDAGLKTIAFPGSGLSHEALYPHTRRDLAHRIVKAGGALISPFGLDQTATAWTFPVRNRLMAGISHAVLIIEGGHGSGTLLTAGNATEFGRDILAVPGSIFSELSYGPHVLIRDGAAIITSSEDVLRALGFNIEPKENHRFLNLAELSLSPEEKRIIAQLQFSPSVATDLIEQTSLPVSMFNVCMSHLELLGAIVEEQGIYRLNQ
jgi:DNA processing protein